MQKKADQREPAGGEQLKVFLELLVAVLAFVQCAWLDCAVAGLDFSAAKTDEQSVRD